MANDLNSSPELGGVIGEVRSIAFQQQNINTAIMAELSKITARMFDVNDIEATFNEYRKLLHERFGGIHQQIADQSVAMDSVERKLKVIEMDIHAWKANLKLTMGALYVVATVTSSLLTTYLSHLVKLF